MQKWWRLFYILSSPDFTSKPHYILSALWQIIWLIYQIKFLFLSTNCFPGVMRVRFCAFLLFFFFHFDIFKKKFFSFLFTFIFFFEFYLSFRFPNQFFSMTLRFSQIAVFIVVSFYTNTMKTTFFKFQINKVKLLIEIFSFFDLYVYPYFWNIGRIKNLNQKSSSLYYYVRRLLFLINDGF